MNKRKFEDVEKKGISNKHDKNKRRLNLSWRNRNEQKKKPFKGKKSMSIQLPELVVSKVGFRRNIQPQLISHSTSSGLHWRVLDLLHMLSIPQLHLPLRSRQRSLEPRPHRRSSSPRSLSTIRPRAERQNTHRRRFGLWVCCQYCTSFQV